MKRETNSKRNGIGFGIFLVAAGALWLLAQTGIFSISPITTLFRLWPLLFIAIGLSIMLSGSRTAKYFIWGGLVLVIAAFSIFGGLNGGIFNRRGNDGTLKTYTKSEALPENAKTARLRLDVGGAQVNIDSGAAGLFDAEIYDRDIIIDSDTGKDSDIRIYSTLKNRTSNQLGDAYEWDIALSEQIIWDVELNAGAISGELDFSDIAAERIDVNIGASKIELMLSGLAEDCSVDLKAGASTISISVPEGTGVKLRYQGALVVKNLESAGLEKSGSYYYSENYSSAENKVDINVEIGVGTLNFKFR